MRVMHVMAGAKEGGAENIMLESVLALAQACAEVQLEEVGAGPGAGGGQPGRGDTAGQ